MNNDNFLYEKFLDFASDSTVSAAQMEQLLKRLNFNVGRKKISFLAEAKVIKKSADNGRKGHGRRCAYDFDSFLDMLIYCILCDTVAGLGKGNACFDKVKILSEVKLLCEVGDMAIEKFVNYAKVAIWLSCSRIGRKNMPFAKQISNQNVAFSLMYRTAMLYKFLQILLKDSSGANGLAVWRAIRSNLMKDTKFCSKNLVKHITAGNTMANTAGLEAILRKVEASDASVRDDLKLWSEIICWFENGSGIFDRIAAAYMRKHHEMEVFNATNNWLAAFTIMRTI